MIPQKARKSLLTAAFMVFALTYILVVIKLCAFIWMCWSASARGQRLAGEC